MQHSRIAVHQESTTIHVAKKERKTIRFRATNWPESELGCGNWCEKIKAL